MKNLLIAVDTWEPKIDGVVRFMENTLPELSKKYKITILAPAFDGISRTETIGKLTVVKFPVSKRIKAAGYYSVKFSFKTLKKIRRFVKESDIVFSQDLAVLGAFAIYYGRRYRKPTISYAHQVSWEHLADVLSKTKSVKKMILSVARKMSKYFYNKCDVMMVASESVADAFENMGITTKKMIVELGVDVHKFVPAKNKHYAKLYVRIDPKKTVIGYCGRVSKEKNLGVLYKAFEEIKKKHDAFLIIIGGGTKSEEARFKGDKDIMLTGMKEEILPYLQAVDIFVMPSLTETSSLVTMEAMSCGIPVVVTPVGAIKEYVKKGFNGYFFPKESPEVLTNRIDDLIMDTDKRKRFGFNARLGIMRYSWKKTVAKIESIIDEYSKE